MNIDWLLKAFCKLFPWITFRVSQKWCSIVHLKFTPQFYNYIQKPKVLSGGFTDGQAQKEKVHPSLCCDRVLKCMDSFCTMRLSRLASGFSPLPTVSCVLGMSAFLGWIFTAGDETEIHLWSSPQCRYLGLICALLTSIGVSIDIFNMTSFCIVAPSEETSAGYQHACLWRKPHMIWFQLSLGYPFWHI